MGDNELLDMLAAETDRRTPTIVEGLGRLADSSQADAEGIEQIRIEVHGLKGAAMVVGEKRLAELAQQVEVALVQRIGPGTIDPELESRLAAAMKAFQEGVTAAAAGDPEPASVGDWIETLSSAA